MKIKHLTRFVLFIFAVIAFACASKKEEGTEEVTATEEKEWKEMDEFHMVMAETFHPYKDSANLEPVKTRASELVASAEKWVGATLPKKVDNDEVKGKLQQLKNEATALAETVKTGDDKTIGDQLTQLHDTFHAIQEAWYGGGGHEHH